MVPNKWVKQQVSEGKLLISTRIRLLNELNPLVASNNSIFVRAWRLVFSLSSFVPYSWVLLFFGKRKIPACRYYLVACRTQVPVPRAVGTWFILIYHYTFIPSPCPSVHDPHSWGCLWCPVSQTVVPEPWDAGQGQGAGAAPPQTFDVLEKHQNSICLWAEAAMRAPSPHCCVCQTMWWKMGLWLISCDFVWRGSWVKRHLQ